MRLQTGPATVPAVHKVGRIDDEKHKIRHATTALSKRGERCMPRRIDEDIPDTVIINSIKIVVKIVENSVILTI